MEHAKTHKKPAKTIEPKVKKPEEAKKEFRIPELIKKFLHKKISITLINGSRISGKLTGFNNYELMLDEKVLIPMHSVLTLQEVETKT